MVSINFASPECLPDGLYICRCFIFIFIYFLYKWSTSEQRVLRNYWTDLQQLFRDLYRAMHGLDKFCIHSAIAQGTLPWQPTKFGKSTFFVEKFSVALSFLNGLEYRNGDGQVRSALNVATSCANTVMISGVTSEKPLIIFVLV